MIKRHVKGMALGLVLVIVLASCGTGTGNISGRVVDADGAPVEGAMVQVAGMSVLTGKDGSYSVAEVPSGDHTISATKAGVGALRSEVTVRSGATTTFDIALAPASD